MPSHHPLPETLVAFASGTLPNERTVVVSCHLAMCRDCAKDVRCLELWGGLMLERLGTSPINKGIFERIIAIGPADPSLEDVEQGRQAGSDDRRLPRLLAPDFPANNEISWQCVSPGLWRHSIAMPIGSGPMRLFRLTPGALLPWSASGADAEIAFVLNGVVTGEDADYFRGDVIEPAEDGDHQFRAAGDVDCICLIAGDAAKPLRALRELREKTAPLMAHLGDVLLRPTALAASLALIAGIGLGWLAGDASGTGAAIDLVTSVGNRLIAQRPLQKELEALPSGEETIIAWGGGKFRLRVKMTFQDQSGAYCRQYQIVTARSANYSGIACRESGEWTVRIQALVPHSPSASAQTIPAGAGANGAMDAVIGAWISGNPLVGEAEAALMSKGWTN